jgi:hypothetical protein
MSLELELEVIWTERHVSDARFYEAGDVGHGLDVFDLNTERDGVVPPGSDRPLVP